MKSLKRKLLGLSKIRHIIVYMLAFFVSSSPITASANRFDPPSLKLPLYNFDQRVDSDQFNVDFLLAHIINNSRKTVREVGELVDISESILLNTAVFTNETAGTTAGSVVIPPGTTADTIIILNQNEGDSIAIQR